MWDRLRASETAEADLTVVRATARGVVSFVTSSSLCRTLVLTVDPGALDDPLARLVVDGLARARDDRPDRDRGGLLVLAPAGAQAGEALVAKVRV